MRSPLPRCCALVAAVLLVTLAAVAGGAVAPAGAAPRPTYRALTLLSQSPFVQQNQDFHLRLGLPASASGFRLEVVAYARLTTRTDFDNSLKGHVRGYPEYELGPEALSSLPADPAGGRDISIPVDPTGAPGPTPAFTTLDASGVFPLQIRLVDGSGSVVGPTLTTYLVYDATAGGGFPPLSVALTLPVHEPPSLTAVGQPARLGRDPAGAVGSLVSALAGHPSVPVTLPVTAQTLESLAGGQGADRATLAGLDSLAAAGHDLFLDSTYVNVSMPALTEAGLGSELRAQLDTGAAAIGAELRRAPAPATWAVDGPLDDSSLATLTARGVTTLVVPESDLSALPSDETQTTLAHPTLLAERNGGHLTVIGADDQLASHFTNGGDQVLAANQLLAEMAMIQLETPGDVRGVAVMAPDSWQPNSAFLGALFAGLDANPLLAPVTVGALAAGVPLAGPSSAPTERTLTGDHGPLLSADDTTSIRNARAGADAYAAVVPSDHATLGVLDRQILTAESADLSPARRRLVAGTVGTALDQLRRSITVAATSITLTARNGGVPVTLLSKAPPGARVQLRLMSEKLSFHPFTPPGGHCAQATTGVESCDLTLASQATTLKVPVSVRASGVFSLDIRLSTPDGKVLLTDSRETVRSTAFSDVGVILIVVAAVALALWWARNIRHGRRARDLVPADIEDEDLIRQGGVPGIPAHHDRLVTGGHDGHADGDGGRPEAPEVISDADAVLTWMDEDPTIAEFFSSPPPDYPPPESRRGPEP